MQISLCDAASAFKSLTPPINGYGQVVPFTYDPETIVNSLACRAVNKTIEPDPTVQDMALLKIVKKELL